MRVSQWNYTTRGLRRPEDPYDPRDTSMWLDYYADNALTKLSRFAAAREIESLCYKESGIGVLMLCAPGITPLGPRRLRDYIKQYRITEAKGIFNNCYEIAEDACRAGRASYQLYSYRSDPDFIGWCDHCVSCDSRPDGTALAYDLTANKNILRRRSGDFHVLGLHAASLGDLQKDIGQLYGGDWEIYSNAKAA